MADLGYDQTFSTEIQEFGVTETRDLIADGRNVIVSILVLGIISVLHSLLSGDWWQQDWLHQAGLSDENDWSHQETARSFSGGFLWHHPKEVTLDLSKSWSLTKLSFSGWSPSSTSKSWSCSSPACPTSTLTTWRPTRSTTSTPPPVSRSSGEISPQTKFWIDKTLSFRFWRALRSFDQTDRAKFLQFVTGSSKVPLQVTIDFNLSLSNIFSPGIRSSRGNERSTEVPDSQRRPVDWQASSSPHLLQSTGPASLRGQDNKA